MITKILPYSTLALTLMFLAAGGAKSISPSAPTVHALQPTWLDGGGGDPEPPPDPGPSLLTIHLM